MKTLRNILVILFVLTIGSLYGDIDFVLARPDMHIIQIILAFILPVGIHYSGKAIRK